MTRRRLGAETSVTIMVFSTPCVYGTRMIRVYELYMHVYFTVLFLLISIVQIPGSITSTDQIAAWAALCDLC